MVSRKNCRWPCTVCKGNWASDAIFCEHCLEWAHYACENLNEDDFQQLSKVSCGYVCKRCCVDQYRRYDFKKSLQRLVIASRNMKDLHHAVIVEQIFLRNHSFQSTTHEETSWSWQSEDSSVFKIRGQRVRGGVAGSYSCYRRWQLSLQFCFSCCSGQ